MSSDRVITRELVVRQDVWFDSNRVYGPIFSLGKLRQISENIDLNDYIIPGMYSVYKVDHRKTIKNLPEQESTAGILKVYNSTGDGNLMDGNSKWVYLKQEFYPFDTFHKFGRICTTGGTSTMQFSEWIQIY